MKKTETFELFESGKHCDAVLPINPVKDEFTIVRFAPLFIQQDGRTEPAVLPSDVVNPQLMGHVLRASRQLPYKVDLPLIRGGFSLNPDWKEWTAPSLLETRKVEVGDRNRFLSDPKVEIDGETYKPHLSPGNIQELMTRGTTVVTVGEDDAMMLVEIGAMSPALDDNPDLAKNMVLIDDLYEFLSDPKVNLGSYGTYSVSLTDKNVEELSVLGTSKVEVTRGGSTASIFVTIPQAPAPAGALSYRTASAHADQTHYPSSELTVRFPGTYPIRPDTTTMPLFGLVPILPSLESVLYLPYRQTWELLGYSRGELLNSISLGPQEETTIEIFTWDRVKRTQEVTMIAEHEGTLEVTATDKDSMETLKEMTKTSNWQSNIGGKVTIPKTPVELNADYHAQDSLSSVNKATHQTIAEAVRKASARIKTTRQTKVTESEEFGREEKVTRKIKNPNMCRALNLDYFEILATYKVTTELALDQVQLCVLADVPLYKDKGLDLNSILMYEGALRDALLFPEVYAKGFEAARILSAWMRLCNVKCLPPCPCDVPAAGPSSLPSSSSNPVQDAVTSAAKAVREAVKLIQQGSPTAMCNIANDVWGNFNPTPQRQQEWAAAKPVYHRWLYRKIAMELLAPRFWDALVQFNQANDNSPEALERLVLSADPQIIDVINVVTLQFRLGLKSIELVIELVTGLCITVTALVQELGFNDGGLDAAFRQARTAVEAYRTASAAPAPSSQSQPTDEAKRREAEQVFEQATPDYPPREIAEAFVDVEALANHIDSNYSYYREAIWRRLDPKDRLMYLQLQGNLPIYVNDEVLGFMGNKAVLPFRTADYPNVNAWFKTNVHDDRRLQTTPAPLTITLPTRGVMMEARLGQCDACEEFIMKHRELDLQQKAAEVKAAEERAKQEALETERYKKRLEKDPPELEDPDPNQGDSSVRLVIKGEKDQ